MSCENKETCPKHGRKYWKRPYLWSHGSYCAGCHAGEMAVRIQYELGIIESLEEIDMEEWLRRTRLPRG